MQKKTEDRRIQRTRQLLQDALVALILEKGFDAVTVQDIIDRANVGRSTFYAHFQDKDDLFLSGFEHLRGEFEQHLSGRPVTPDSPWTMSLVLFQHAQNYQRVYQALVGRQGGNIVLTHIHKYLVAVLQEHFKMDMPERVRVQVPPEILAHYLVSSLMALLTWWLDHDLPYPPERMNEMYRLLVEPGILGLMDN